MRFSIVEDEELLDKLNSEPIVTVYRAMQQVTDENGKVISKKNPKKKAKDKVRFSTERKKNKNLST